VSNKCVFGGAEIVGLGIVGATIGAVLCGGAVSDFRVFESTGAIIGAVCLPAAVIIPWARLLRLVPRPTIRTPKESLKRVKEAVLF